MGTKTTKRVTRDLRERLWRILEKVDRPGTFCLAKDLPMLMPGLEVDGIGPIGLPLTKTQAGQLIKQCRQAPYGKGTRTVVDTDVRRVWELDPDRFRLTNPNWGDALLVSVISEAKQELGLEGQKLAAHLYKLLVYEEGSFFLPHRDGEKLDGMVATLVIALPSVHQGGELVVSHDGRDVTLRMNGAASGLELSYAAFYADCEHEVRPVRSGYRLCLAYNLTLEKARSRKGIHAPSFGGATHEITDILRSWDPGDEPDKLAVTLDHRYTQDGLTIGRLKGVDRARADVLFEAAEQAGCVSHLALVTLWQSGSAEGGYEDYSYGRRRRSYWSDDQQEDVDDGVSEYEMGEVYDHRLSADHWSDREGKKASLGEIHFDETEILSDPLEDWEASQEHFEGYTGNAGMTLERWYHRAAVVLWPRARQFAVLCAAGTDASIGGLQGMVKSLKPSAKSRRESLRQECLAFAGAIIDSWEVGRSIRWSAAFGSSQTIDRDVFPKLLCDLNDVDLVRRFLSKVMTRDGDLQLGKPFVKFCKQHGWEHWETALGEVLQTTTTDTLHRNTKLVELLCVQRDKDSARLKVCNRICAQAVAVLVAFDTNMKEGDWRAQELNRAEIVTSLVRAMLAVDSRGPLRQLINHTLAASATYDLTETHLAAIFALEPQLKKCSASKTAVSHWIKACRRELAGRTAEGPQPPADFRREQKLSCTCSDCRTLSAFLADPDKKQLRIALAKARRQHLHQVIDGHRCDLTHVTERRGRPYTLVCTKTTASYKLACETYDRDLKHLARIDQLLEGLSE